MRERAGQGGGGGACSALWLRWPGERAAPPCTGQADSGTLSKIIEVVCVVFLCCVQLCRGLVPGLQRQMAFSAIRIGLYENFKR